MHRNTPGPAIGPRLARRRALAIAWQGLAAGAATVAGAGCAGLDGPAPRFVSDPFALGVASGCPRADAVVLWTRLAPRPLEPSGGLDPVPIRVRWELADGPDFARVIASGRAVAAPERAHAVHVEARGLAPGREYWYRFHAGAATSPAGRTRTMPTDDALPARLRFAFASCQHYEQGFYGAWRHMADEALDLVVHLGDYIYENPSWGGHPTVRKHVGGDPRTLDAYRQRHAQYRSDPDLQRMHALAPWLLTWDDHEVDNDYADDRGQDLAPDFLARRAAAYRAYFEHMPLPGLAAGGPLASTRLHDRFAFGRLASFHVLDDRQYRSHHACPRPGRGGSNVVDVDACAELADASRTMLGLEQERWLEAGLAADRARWTVIAQQTLFSGLDNRPGPGRAAWTDGWDGYPAARERLLEAIARHRPRNPVFIGGDVHSNWVCDVHRHAHRPESPVIASEFCGTSITSAGFAQSRIDPMLPDNPHVKLADGTKRGYTVVEVTPARWQATLRVIDDPRDPRTGIATRARFVVEDGRPGPQRD